MQKLNTLWQLVNAASDITSMTRHTQTYHFSTFGQPITFYLRAEHAEVRIMRWTLAKVEVTAALQAAFGWRVAADQDEAGVYVAAKRKPVLGNLSTALFSVVLPHDAHLILSLNESRLVLENINATLQIPPQSESGYHLLPAG
jgi:hypothetical protein